jgi:hypothetical protein
LGAFFAEYRKKPGFAGVPSRQNQKTHDGFFDFDATA